MFRTYTAFVNIVCLVCAWRKRRPLAANPPHTHRQKKGWMDEEFGKNQA